MLWVLEGIGSLDLDVDDAEQNSSRTLRKVLNEVII